MYSISIEYKVTLDGITVASGFINEGEAYQWILEEAALYAEYQIQSFITKRYN